MQCREASELVSLRLDVELLPAADQSLREHLLECETCHCEAEALARLDRLFSSAPVVSPGPQFAGRVMARVQRRRRWMAVLRGGAVLVLGMAIVTALCLLPLAHPASPVAGVLNSPSLVSALVGVLVRLANLASTLVGAARLVGVAFLDSSGHLFLAGLMALAAGLAFIWLRLLGRASAAVGKAS